MSSIVGTPTHLYAAAGQYAHPPEAQGYIDARLRVADRSNDKVCSMRSAAASTWRLGAGLETPPVLIELPEE